MTWKEAEPPDTDLDARMRQEGRGSIHARCEKVLRDELLRFNAEYAEAWGFIDEMIEYVQIFADTQINPRHRRLLEKIEKARKPHASDT